MSEPLPNRESQGPGANIQAETPAPTAEGPIVYRPISGWAIAGFVTGTLFTLLVAVSAVVGLVQGTPVFFPIWIIGIAILGVALSLHAQRHVQNSEGTRVGAKLAKVGLWLSVVSCLMYFSYYFVTGMALESQANAFLMDEGDDTGFFKRLLKGDDPTQINTAFLYTQTSRSGRPEDEKSMRERHDIPRATGGMGALSQFREGILARIFYKDLAKDAEITPLAVQEWDYKQRSYRVYRAYRIKTKEIEVELVVPAWSMEAASPGQGRKWFVNMNELKVVSKTLTPLGLGVARLRESAGMWLARKLEALNEGDSIPNIAQLDQTPWNLLPAKDDARTALHLAFRGPGKPRLSQTQVFTRPEDPGKWEQVDGKMRLFLTFRCYFPKVPGQPPHYNAEGTAAVESRNAIDPAKFDGNGPAPDWDLVRLVFHSATSISGN